MEADKSLDVLGVRILAFIGLSVGAFIVCTAIALS
jgi:hypothetical protein